MRSEELDDASLIIFGGPRQMFHTGEFNRIKQLLEKESPCCICQEGGEGAEGDEQRTNFNYLGEFFLFIPSISLLLLSLRVSAQLKLKINACELILC